MGQNLMMAQAHGIRDFAKVPVNVTMNATRDITGAMAGAGRSAPTQPAQQPIKPFDEVRLSRLIRDVILQVID